MTPLFALLTATLLTAAPQPAPDLSATLARLDASSARFTSAQASVRRDSFNSFIKETESQSGTTYFIRDKSGSTEMGLKTTGKDSRTVLYKNGTLRDFNASANCTDTVTKPGIETYLTLGFGGSGKDLAKLWNISDLGPETVDNTRVEKLELIPKIPTSNPTSPRSPSGSTSTATSPSSKSSSRPPATPIPPSTPTSAGSATPPPHEIKGKPCGR